MPYSICAEFERIEDAENAASRIKSQAGVQRFTITKQAYKKDSPSPFVLPYPPAHGMDNDILRPRGYGYPTRSGYFEPSLSEKCQLRFIADEKGEVTRILHNAGANGISAVSVAVN